MKWKELKKAYSALINKAKETENFSKEWKRFKTIADQIAQNPPLALSSIHYSLSVIEKKIKKKDIFIFDHGIGSGMKSIYLAALGYYNIHGVNRNGDVSPLNKILKKIFGIKTKNFFITNGREIPFPSSYFNFIMSIQVAEHVTEDLINVYYAEEGRVLKKGGYVYHELPHKLMPYESHSRLWFIHLFPFFCKPLLYGFFVSLQQKKNLIHKGNYYANRFSKEYVILRTPNFHKKMLLNHIGQYQDLTVTRLLKYNDFSVYDKDSPLMLRKIIQKLFSIPYLGILFAHILKNFFILQTLSKRIVK